jgi:diacylglycerol kinase family enzyme
MSSVPVLVNPRSGGGFSDDDARRLAQLFGKAGAQAEVHPTHSPKEMRRLAEQLVAARAPLIVGGGGDGTVNAIASVVAGTETALGVLPLGTLNHFARDLGIPLTLDAAVETVVRGKRRPVDVADVNGRVFVNNSSIGLYPAMVHKREKLRRRLGRGKWPAMLWAMHTVLRSHPFLDLTLELDGAAQQRQGRLRLVLLALRALVGRLHQARDFEAGITRELRIDSRHKRVLVATDGEVAALDMPLQYRIRPGALQVIAP